MRDRIFLLLLTAILGLTAAGPAVAADRSRRVLIVESFGRDVAPLSRMILAFRAELRGRWPEPIDLFEVSLESARSARPDEDGGLVNFLAERLARDPVDLVVPFGTPAMRFVARHRDRLFPRAPILIAAVEKRLLLPELLGPRTVVVGPRWHVAWTVEDILQVLPGTREIVVVHGASPLEQFWVQECQREFARFTDRVRFRWLNGMPFVAMKREVAALPRDAAVLYTMLFRDAAGVTFEQDQALLGLRAVSTAPVFSGFESQLGYGIVGGRLLPDRSLGVDAAVVAARILDGAEPATIHLPPLEERPPAFDWRELKRWGISEADLPPGSSVLYRPVPFWDQYRWHVLGVLAIVGFQTALIAGLLLQRRRRNRAEGRLAQSERRLLLITDSLPVLISYVDSHQRHVFNNRAYKAWFDVDPDRALGRTMAEVLGNDLYRQISPYLQRVLMGEQVSFAIETTLARGERRSIEAIHVPDRDERGIVRGFYSLMVDVTDRKGAEREARRLKDDLAHSGRVATMGEMAAALAHELNQPLAAILINAQAATRFLNAPSPDLDEIRAILLDIAGDDARAGEVLRRIRALVKKEATDIRPLSLNLVLNEVVALLRSDAMIRGVSLSFELDLELPRVRGDRIQLQQVLLNLLLNAFDAMSESPPGERTVLIRSQHDDFEVRISVSDQGHGIRPGELDGLFEPFWSTKPNGLGMGLSISRSIVTSHGGRLWAENNLGRGATFVFALPVHVAAALAGCAT